MNAVTKNQIPSNVSAIDSAIQVLRICTEQSLYDAADLIAKLLTARSRASHAAIALHLAEQFVRLVQQSGIDAGLNVVGADLIAAINRAKGKPPVLAHYEAMARDAQRAAA